MESESASMTPARGSLSFRRIVDVPFETCMAALGSWQLTGQGGDLRFGGSVLRGPIEHDHDSGTRRIQVRLDRGPLRSMLPMRLDIDRRSSSSTAVELIPDGRVRPTAAYFRAGHRLLDALTRSLPQHVPPCVPGTVQAGRTCPSVPGFLDAPGTVRVVAADTTRTGPASFSGFRTARDAPGPR